MNEILRQIADLPPEKRELLKLLLQKQGVDLTASGITPVPRDGRPLPLSFSQQRLWFLEELEPGSPTYVIPCIVKMRGAVDVQILEQSLNDVIRRHEVLRTTFLSVDDQPTQVVSAEMPIVVQSLDVRALPLPERDAEVQRLMTDSVRQPFDLSRGPLLRATLVRLGEKEWLLLMPMHHSVSDGWSTGVLLHELRTFYQAHRDGRPASLPPLRIQYADFASWQREHLQGETLEAHVAYWRKQLEGSSEVLDLATDFPRPPIQTYNGALAMFAWTEELTRRLNELARRENATLFMVLVALFQTVLYRTTRQADINIGTPVANRNRAETELLIGFFVNTIVLRSDLSGNPTFRQFLARVRDVTLGAFAHEDLPFETVVEQLNPRRDLSTSPFFQVMFVLNNAPIESLEVGGVELEPVEVDTGTAKFDVVLSMMEERGRLLGKMEFNTDLFQSATITRMLLHLQRCAEAAVLNPDACIDILPLLDADERTKILVEWNRKPPLTDMLAPVHELFERQVAAAPDRAALVLGDQSVTYRALNGKANALAHRLRNMGVGPEMPVGVFLERSIESIVSLLAILKAGGVYLPLDISYPRERIAFMLADAGASIVVTQANLLDLLPAVRGKTIALEKERDVLDGGRDDAPAGGAMPETGAYIIYTSGSTGQPKGVLVSHRALGVHCLDMARYYQLVPGEKVLQFSALNFDASLEQIFPTLFSGGTLVMRGPEIWSAEEFRVQVERHDLSVVNLPTAYWQQLLQEWKASPELVPDRQVRLFIIGGDQIVAEAVRLWHGTSLGRSRLLNAYGPTETVITATASEIPIAELDYRSRIPIGRALSQRTVYVLDQQGEPVPVGVPGELHIGGECLARGYLHRPDLTADRFIPDRFSSSAGGRLYRTGDLVRYRADGTLEFLGRVDQQVKVRGFRVELGEIESVLLGHPSVREGVVLAREDGRGEKRLVAFVVFREGAGGGIAQVREYLKSKLPDHMVPSVFVEMAALPVNAVGKIDRRALPVPKQDRPEMQQEFVAPRTPVEETIAGIVARTLGLERVGVRDNFFDLGGHSMLATQVISRVRKEFEIDIPLRRVFESPTVEGLALAVTKSQAEQIDPAELQRMLDQLDQLSGEEVTRLLTQDAEGDPDGHHQ